MTQSHMTAKTTATAAPADSATPEAVEEGIVAQTDDLLDEIDTLLEDVSVLVGFRQRSGQ